jgi:hypothetical protein
MAKLTNYTAGARGINLKAGGTHWLEPGESVDLEDDAIVGDVPDLGKPGAAHIEGVALADMNRAQLEATMRAEADFSGASDDKLREAIQKARDAKAKATDGPDLSVLNANVTDLPGKLAELDLDHLVALRQAEADGQARKGALAAIDDAIAAKQAS